MSPQPGVLSADFGKEVVSVAPDDHVRSQPSKSDQLALLWTLDTHYTPLSATY